ncbi:ATP-binding protein [Siminovitchia sp. FSL W7-1587]|uniref:ATP-binding protein n=1 Tax=Siminovitchia sp. FSL W7-1587 TaxID=2954699 RepID=UPI0030D1CC8D
MKRDVAIIPFNDRLELVVACDNSGAIGMKPDDQVAVPYEIVSYYSFRVAFMECVSAGAVPFSVVLYNFCGDCAWFSLKEGITKGIRELGLEELSITGSTETNFSLSQSAVGISVLGKREKRKEAPLCLTEQMKVAVIGKPLVGNEVIECNGDVAPLRLFQWFSRQKKVLAIVPVGSKGILYELRELFAAQSLQFSSPLNMEKTAGPSTCFIVVYDAAAEDNIRMRAGRLFHPVQVIT